MCNVICLGSEVDDFLKHCCSRKVFEYIPDKKNFLYAEVWKDLYWFASLVQCNNHPIGKLSNFTI